MHFTNTIVAAIALVTTTLATPALNSRQEALKPWSVTGIIGFTPSGRPGSYPWPAITANVTDPNALILGTSAEDNSSITVPAGNLALNCQAKWLSGESPIGRSWPCDSTGDGYWTLRIASEDWEGVGNFTAVFTRVADVLYRGSQYKKTYQGSAHFEVGKNLGGTCGGSGTCSWGLKDGPVAIQQHEVA